jgi:hypothetical protein
VTRRRFLLGALALLGAAAFQVGFILLLWYGRWHG